MNLFEKLNRLDDSLVESKRVVKKKKLIESYSDEMTEFMNWIQEYKNGALWDDFAAEFESEEDPDISVVLTWLENFDEDAYYNYVAAETYDDDIDKMLTESIKVEPIVDKIVNMIEHNGFTNRSVSSTESTITMEDKDGGKTTYAIKVKMVPHFILEEELAGIQLDTTDKNTFIKEASVKILSK